MLELKPSPVNFSVYQLLFFTVKIIHQSLFSFPITNSFFSCHNTPLHCLTAGSERWHSFWGKAADGTHLGAEHFPAAYGRAPKEE